MYIYIYIIYIHVYICYIYIYVYPDMAKHQSKPRVYKSDIAPCRRHRIQENSAYLLQSEDRHVGEATDINQGFVFCNYNTRHVIIYSTFTFSIV